MNSSMLKKGSKRGSSSRGRRIFSEENSVHKFNRIKKTNLPADKDDDYGNTRNSQDQAVTHSRSSSPYNVSPMEKSPWSSQKNTNIPFEDNDANFSPNVLMGSLVREEGHIYSLAASGDLLYTGSDSKNIRVWKNQKEFPGLKSNSGLVKAIVISGAMIFTGHQDGKIRVWKVSSKDPSIHKRIGTLPTMKDYFKNSMKTSNYIEVKRHSNAVWYKHCDAISCLSLSEDRHFFIHHLGTRLLKFGEHPILDALNQSLLTMMLLIQSLPETIAWSLQDQRMELSRFGGENYKGKEPNISFHKRC